MKKIIFLIISFYFFSNVLFSQDSIKGYSEVELKKINKYIVVLDPAHGEDVPGKRSPDGLFREYQFSREIITLLSDLLDSAGIKYDIDNKKDYEIGLNKRVSNTNNIVRKYGKYSLFISIHCNAAGMGDEWMNARGYSIYTTRGLTRGDQLAERITEVFESEFPDIKNRGLLEANFKVLKCKPPAVLIETMFQDNQEDVEIMSSDDFKIRYARVILKGIIEFILND